MPRQAGDVETTQFQRGRIVALYEEGRSERWIARELGLSRNTVHRWVVRFQETGRVDNNPRSGAPRVTTAQQDQELLETVRRQPVTNARALHRELQLDCSDRTVRNRLNEFGLYHRTPATKERLSRDNVDCRLGFALEFLPKDRDFWNTVIFTDEKTFAPDDHGQLHVYRPRSTRYETRHVVQLQHSGRINCSAWGWVSASGVGELVRIDGRFNSQKYLDILNNVLMPSLQNRIPAATDIPFVHDRSPIHTATVIREWLQQQPMLSPVPWPSKGADLNPIENVWGLMVREWQPGHHRNGDDMWNHMQEVWTDVGRTDICRRLIQSMPDRINEVVSQHGHWTHY